MTEKQTVVDISEPEDSIKSLGFLEKRNLKYPQTDIPICIICNERDTSRRAKRGYCLICYKREVHAKKNAGKPPREKKIRPIRIPRIKLTPEEKLKRKQEYYERNRERKRLYRIEYRKKYPERIKEYENRWKKRLRETRRAIKERYSQLTPDELLEHIKFKKLPKAEKPLSKEQRNYVVW